MTTDPITDAARVLLAAHTFGAVRLDAWVCAECGAPLAMPGWEAAVETTTGGLLREAMARHQTELLAEAGLLAAPDLLQIGPRVGASRPEYKETAPELAISPENASELAEDLRSASLGDWFRKIGTGLSDEQCALVEADLQEAPTEYRADDLYAARDTLAGAPQAPADPPAGVVESGQGGSGAVRGVVEDRMRALAADMDRDTPLTAEILRQFADEVTHLRAAGDRAIQSIVSRLPEADDPTTPDRN